MTRVLSRPRRARALSNKIPLDVAVIMDQVTIISRQQHN